MFLNEIPKHVKHFWGGCGNMSQSGWPLSIFPINSTKAFCLHMMSRRLSHDQSPNWGSFPHGRGMGARTALHTYRTDTSYLGSAYLRMKQKASCKPNCPCPPDLWPYKNHRQWWAWPLFYHTGRIHTEMKAKWAFGEGGQSEASSHVFWKHKTLSGQMHLCNRKHSRNTHGHSRAKLSSQQSKVAE